MIPHVCTVKHNPPHSYGDCLRTSVASLLDIDRVQDVPHFADDGEDPTPAMQRYLATHGLRAHFNSFDGSASADDILHYMKAVNPGVYYLLYGRSAIGEDHVAIYLNDKKVHDTAWLPMPLIRPSSAGVWTVCVFVSLRLTVNNEN